jgi:chromate transporter
MTAARATGAEHGRRLRELALLFLKLGFIGFGGPAAHIAMMEEEVVCRRAWLSREAFLDLLGATNLIPGPNSTEMAIHIGHQRAGAAGLVVAGTCFILPAMLLVMACGWVYVKFGSLPQVGALLYGVKPVIIAIVAQALWGLAKTAVKTRWLALLGLGIAVAAFLGVNELMLLFLAGVAAAVHGKWRLPAGHGAAISIGFTLPTTVVAQTAAHLAAVATVASAGVVAVPFGIWPLLLFFLKVGSVLFGSGYVLLAFLRADLVERWHWLTEAQLLDAVAVGQITPGPVFTTATFIGYILGGVPAALAATIGIFLPAFLFVAISAPFIPKLRASRTAGAFLDGLNVASLALMAVVTWHLGRGALPDVFTVVIALSAAVLLFRFRVNSVWLVAGGAAVGFVIFRL